MSNAILDTQDVICVSPEDLRCAPRHRTFKKGRVALNNVFSTIDAIIRDLSETGARLRLAQPTILPKNFDLVIFDANTDTYTSRPACLKWQKGNDAGVEFVGVKKSEDFSKKKGTVMTASA